MGKLSLNLNNLRTIGAEDLKGVQGGISGVRCPGYSDLCETADCDTIVDCGTGWSARKNAYTRCY